ncbi:beta-lactamase/transpeptidase-like protein [Mycena galericulata]|nr:beta-lactamase/transpeptidase-like protein [Mycena galericulata]
MASILPEWKLMDPVASSESTITDLMSHRTGLPSHDDSLSASDDLPSVIRRLRYLKPSASFRDNLQYTNMMYAVLSYLPTALLPDKPPFARYVKEQLFDPLQMNSSTYSVPLADATGRMADGFVRVGVNTSANPLGPGTPMIVSSIMPTVGLDGNGVHSLDPAVFLLPRKTLRDGCRLVTGFSVWDGNAEYPELSPMVYGAGQMQLSYRGHVMIEHGGDLPGFHSQVTRFPNDGFGVAVLTNDDAFGTYFKEVIKFRIIDEVLGLQPVDWNTRYQAEAMAGSLSVEPTPPKSNATLPFPLTTVLGTYQNLGYGADVELCSAIPQSDNCTALVGKLNSTFPAELAAADLVWVWEKFGASYVGLSHFDGPIFNVSGWIAMPTSNSSSPFWGYDAGFEGNVAEFDVDTARGQVIGFGIRGGIWVAGVRGDGDPSEGEPQGKTVEERSEVWYQAISGQAKSKI